MKVYKYPTDTLLKELLTRPAADFSALEAGVRNIFSEVYERGDEALRDFTKEFDKVDAEIICHNTSALFAQGIDLADELKAAIEMAAKNIRTFHQAQAKREEKVETMPGVVCWRESRPVQKVGFYIPGGTAPLFSTVLMLGIPAQIAGCEEIVLCTPPRSDGSIHPAIVYAAKLTGIHKICAVGGAQAIAAMTFGTESVPAVYKIFGPGNAYVTVAKQLAQQFGVAIDMPAGPSEVMVVADETAEAPFVAADLLSQAEHGADSQVILVALNELLIEPVLSEIEQQAEMLERSALIKKSLDYSRIILAENRQRALNMVNEYAPEHLILSINEPHEFASGVMNAGSIFLGNYSPESVGDYASGTNHTLPTNGYAKAYSGVSVDSFVKKITFQELSEDGLSGIRKIVTTMAEAEGLTAHKNAINIRTYE